MTAAATATMTTATAITTTIATAATVTAAKITSAATTTAIFAWLGFIHLQSAAVDLLTIKLVNSCRSFGVGLNLDKRESAGASSLAVFDHAC